MFRPQVVSLNCPHCGTAMQAPIFSILDVGQQPEFKQALLAGQLNAAQCPGCGNVHYLATPLLYHDPSHDFLAVFMPAQLNLNEQQRQKAIGDLTKALMDALPAEQRRGYMLTPQQFLTMESLVEKVLGFDGVTPEMIAASRKKVEMVSELARIKEDGIAFGITVKENEALLDQEFFMLLSNFILSSQQEGQTEQAEALVDLREKLLPLTEIGGRILKQRQAVSSLGENPTRESLMEALLKADTDEAEAIAVVARQALDYQFFQDYTARIEAAPAAERPALEAVRERVLAVLEDLRAGDQQALQSAGEVIQKLLGAEDMEQAVQQMLPMIDQNAMAVLMANIQNAEKEGATAAANRLKYLWDLINQAMEQAVPPPLRLLYELAEADYPAGTRQILQERKDEITPEFLQFLEESISEIEKASEQEPERAEAVRQLKNVLTQAKLGV